MTNFDFLKTDSQFDSFADIAVSAENLLHIDADACVLNCRRAMEFAVKWMYSVDRALDPSLPETLISMMNDKAFKELIGPDIWQRMDFIRKLGNSAAHSGKKITEAQAELCLENLYYFLDQVAHFYAKTYTGRAFDRALLALTPQEALSFVSGTKIDLAALAEENAAMKEELTVRRAKQQQTYVPKPLELSAYGTRKLYIDLMLQDADWVKGKDWLDGAELPGMENKPELGHADHVLWGDDGRPLALLETKYTCEDISEGRRQARQYADRLEAEYKRRPVIFLSDGFGTSVNDNVYPERSVASVYSKRDLEKLFNLQTTRASLAHVCIDQNIAGRYYQEGAVKAVCSAFEKVNRRKALLVMAAGTGKTRTVIELCRVLLAHGWVKNILFLADRAALVTQAKRSFAELLPNLEATDLCAEQPHPGAQCVFATYQTIIDAIDTVRDEKGKVFTPGHFDLLICDEAHRSIYNKYRDVFRYFDALLVGLTAAPKDDVDQSIYQAFGLESGAPTYDYELAQAVEDGFLVDFVSVETSLKFIQEDSVYDDLPEEEKQACEDTFEAKNGRLPSGANAASLNEWIFDQNTIRQVLHILMTDGLKIDSGSKIGKTILFAENHRHAETILDVFSKEYPRLPGYAEVIDNDMPCAQSAIDAFSDPKQLPQIAISVDVLDIGIDVPQVLNLVFFKRVMSKAKFWQMIGRGTRLCPDLTDGQGKEKFYIFDFCGNFEFFRMEKGGSTASVAALRRDIFNLKAQIAFKLQDQAYQTPELVKFRTALVGDMVCQVRRLDRAHFAVKLHLKYVERYAEPEQYQALTDEDILLIGQEVAPLIASEEGDPATLRFDALLYEMELACLTGETTSKARSDLAQTVAAISAAPKIPEIMAQSELIDQILHSDRLDAADVGELEHIRAHLRGLIQYVPAGQIHYDSDFDEKMLREGQKKS